MRYSTVIAAALLGSIAWSGAIAAEKPRYNPGVPVAQGPVHDSRTGSYFELLVSKRAHNYWHLARDEAGSRTYKGRRGRLAVIKDLETLEFVREHFRLNEEAWIGLQFYCRFRKLVWVSGETQPLRNPGMWAPTWYRNQNMRCTTQRWDTMPIYLTREGEAEVSWQATGPAKTFVSFLVEYPPPPAEAKEPATEAPRSDKSGQ